MNKYGISSPRDILKPSVFSRFFLPVDPWTGPTGMVRCGVGSDLICTCFRALPCRDYLLHLWRYSWLSMADESIIGTLRVNLSFPGLDKTDQAVPKADRLTEEAIVPTLEKIVRDYGWHDMLLDSLEIDLGTVSSASLSSALEQALRNELDRRAGPMLRHFVPDDPLITVQVDMPAQTGGSESPSPVEQLVAYLSGQTIPWDEDFLAFNPVVLFDRAMSALVGISDGLVSVQADRPIERPVLETVVESVISRLEPLHYARLMGLARRSERFPELAELIEESVAGSSLSQSQGIPSPSVLERMDVRKAVWNAYRKSRFALPSGSPSILRPHTTAGRETEDAAVSEETIPDSRQDGRRPSFSSFQESVHAGSDVGSSSDGDKVPPADSLHAVQSDPGKDNPSAGTWQADDWTTPSGDSSRAEHPEALSPQDSVWEITPEEAEPVPERLFISDAGLVLIHPFIRKFFENLKLVDREGRFVSGVARVHAVHLLRHVTGYDDEHLGHRLLLEKVLCGLPADYLVPEEWEATPVEEEEIQGMLTALMSYWPSLRKSSVVALQKGFLQRPGSIGMQDGSILVRVEGSAIDILMEDLPWETSFILLSWLDKPILVEWQN